MGWLVLIQLTVTPALLLWAGACTIRSLGVRSRLAFQLDSWGAELAWADMPEGLQIFWAAVVLVCWAMNDGDDRWKRRRRKLAEKVGQLGGKLVVVPVR